MSLLIILIFFVFFSELCYTLKMGTTLHNKKSKGSNIPLIIGGFVTVAIIIGIGLYMYSLQCKDGEEMIEGKCLIKCTDGQTRVGVVCTTSTGSEVVVCKDGEEMIEGKCLVKCPDGIIRTGVFCVDPNYKRLVCSEGEEIIGNTCLVKCPNGSSRGVDGVCRIPTGRDGVECKSNEELYLFDCKEKCTDGKTRNFKGICETPKDIKGVNCKPNEELYKFMCKEKCTDGKTRNFFTNICETPPKKLFGGLF